MTHTFYTLYSTLTTKGCGQTPAKRDTMDIKALTVADLKAALSSEDFWHTRTLPITKHRALSYIHNPRASDDDIVLLVAYQDSLVIGYVGILPDKIFTDNRSHRIGWLTSWWVDPVYAGSGVGAVLLFKALNAFGQNLGVSGSSRDAGKVLDATRKFMSLKTIKGLDIRLRFNLSGAWLRKRPALKSMRLLLKLLDGITDEIVNCRSLAWQRNNAALPRLTFEYISTIDEETDRFIQKHNRKDLTRKTAADLNWIMKYPWILPAPLKDSTGSRYFFSSRADRFFYLGVKVFDQEKKLAGFFLARVRDDRMSIVFAYYDHRHARSIAAAAFYHALKMDVGVLSFYDEQLVAGFTELDCPCRSIKRVSRGFSLSKTLADMPPPEYRLHGGDGDLAFY